MTIPSFLVSNWDNGIFVVAGTETRHERAGQSVRGLAADGRGGVLAVVDGHSLCRRAADGAWTTLLKSDFDLSCCLPLGDDVFVGTDDARVLRVGLDGAQHDLTGFAATEGRGTWYAGTAIVDGRVMGPPLGIRSMTATCDGGVLLANVHVGGIPRSTDGGATWRPTIAVESDVHQVCAHPTRPEIVIAAAAAGLCVSRDAGATWTVDTRGLHTPHCSGVALSGDHLFISASTDPFAAQGAVYRCPVDGDGPVERLGAGLPQWSNGIVDTGCIAAQGATIALIDRSGGLYVSQDDGATWARVADLPPGPSGLHIC